MCQENQRIRRIFVWDDGRAFGRRFFHGVECTCRDTACRVRQFVSGEIPLKTFHRNVFKIKVQQAGHRAERSCSLRPRKAVAFLTHLLRAPEHGAGNFAVCGQRLRGHVPSKNTSPAALSWSSLFGDSFSESFRFCTILFDVCLFGFRSAFCRDTASRVRSFISQRDQFCTRRKPQFLTNPVPFSRFP